jgi:two pore calcium channel protein 1
MTSVALVMLLLYYFFAIIAMEIFSGVQLRNCCNGTIYDSYYADPDPSTFTNTTNVALRYYLNSFEVTFLRIYLSPTFTNNFLHYRMYFGVS